MSIDPGLPRPPGAQPALMRRRSRGVSSPAGAEDGFLGVQGVCPSTSKSGTTRCIHRGIHQADLPSCDSSAGNDHHANDECVGEHAAQQSNGDGRRDGHLVVANPANTTAMIVAAATVERSRT